MTKKITKERLLKTLENIDRARASKTGKGLDMIRAFTQLGMQISCDKAFKKETQQVHFDRADLELDLLEIPKSREDLLVVQEETFRQVNRYCAKSQYVFKVQAKHKISGLAPYEMILGEHTLDTVWDSDELSVIEEDLAILKREKNKVVAFLLNSLEPGQKPWIWNKHNKEVLSCGTWEECSWEKVRSAIAFHDWVHAWDREGTQGKPDYGLIAGSTTDLRTTSKPHADFAFCATHPHY